MQGVLMLWPSLGHTFAKIATGRTSLEGGVSALRRGPQSTDESGHGDDGVS